MLAEISADDRVVVLDLAAVAFVSSAGFRALLMIAKARGIEVRLCRLLPEVQAMFTMSGFDRIIAVFESREEAFK